MKIRRSIRGHRELAVEIVHSHRAVASAIQDRSSESVPIQRLCRLLGVIDVVPMPMHVEGFLVNKSDGLAIRVNANRSVARQRFTIAHELGHILLSLHEGKQIQIKCRTQHFATEEEYLVDMIAAELLMPIHEISGLIHSGVTGWEVIERIVWSYRVSYSAAIRRLLNVADVHGAWITANQERSESLSAWCTPSIRRIADAFGIWKTFCWDPKDGRRGWIDVVVSDSFGRQKHDRLMGELKFMHKMGRRQNGATAPNNCWLLAWTTLKRPMVQLMLDFGMEF